MRTLTRVAWIGGLWVILHSASSFAQIPDTFENLQVLDKNIDRRVLIDTMRGFAGALGVRCNHCHVGEDTNSLQGMDWASDDKASKQVARGMMKMVKAINGDYIAAMMPHEVDRVQVSCVTCHRGQTKPRLIEDVLREARDEGGIDSLEARYVALRSRYYGRATFDFSEDLLSDLAQESAQQGDLDGAMQLARMNLEYYPENSVSYIVMGQIAAQQGDKKAAVEYLQKALEYQPHERMKDRIRRMIEQIQSE
jgi:hypothetical protein